jgi:hypothetical protein
MSYPRLTHPHHLTPQQSAQRLFGHTLVAFALSPNFAAIAPSVHGGYGLGCSPSSACKSPPPLALRSVSVDVRVSMDWQCKCHGLGWAITAIIMPAPAHVVRSAHLSPAPAAHTPPEWSCKDGTTAVRHCRYYIGPGSNPCIPEAFILYRYISSSQRET